MGSIRYSRGIGVSLNKCIVSRRKLAVFAVGLTMLLGGCNATQGIGGAPRIPSVRSVANEVKARREIDIELDSKKITPKRYVEAGYELVKRECDKFFDDLQRVRLQARATRAGVQLATSLTSGFLVLLTANPSWLALTALSGSALDQIFGHIEHYIIIAEFPDETRKMVFTALKTYETNFPPSRVLADNPPPRNGNGTQVPKVVVVTSPPPSFDKARDMVRGFASICTTVEIVQFFKDSIARSKFGVTDESELLITDINRILVETALKISNLSDDQLALIYGLLVKGATNHVTERQKIEKFLQFGDKLSRIYSVEGSPPTVNLTKGAIEARKILRGNIRLQARYDEIIPTIVRATSNMLTGEKLFLPPSRVRGSFSVHVQ